jgi:hypothetical protein
VNLVHDEFPSPDIEPRTSFVPEVSALDSNGPEVLKLNPLAFAPPSDAKALVMARGLWD